MICIVALPILGLMGRVSTSRSPSHSKLLEIEYRISAEKKERMILKEKTKLLGSQVALAQSLMC